MGSDAVRSVAVVVTSIFEPTVALQEIARQCIDKGFQFIVVGDEASPSSFSLKGCQFHSLTEQIESDFEFAKLCPVKKYSRKNIGYLLAACQGAEIILETDDDNIPYTDFGALRERCQSVPQIESKGWINAYRYFTDALIWPRGLPLDQVNCLVPDFDSLETHPVDCPIQQGLADDNPDVDAIYRLILPLPLKFRKDRRIALGSGSWCPFNSQNTTWWKDAFPLLYLPTYCSFRMTDIWRSLVAQKIAWANGWSILFHEPTVRQERNEHDLMKDFRQEIDGYVRNRELGNLLENISCKSGVEAIPGNLLRCYEKLADESFVDKKEIDLLQAWLLDLDKY